MWKVPLSVNLPTFNFKNTAQALTFVCLFATSVLETEKSLVLAEKGSGDRGDVELIKAAANFRLVATMNPGGDFGKKEVMKWCKMVQATVFPIGKFLLDFDAAQNSCFHIYNRTKTKKTQTHHVNCCKSQPQKTHIEHFKPTTHVLCSITLHKISEYCRN